MQGIKFDENREAAYQLARWLVPVAFFLTELRANPDQFWSRQREIAELVRDHRNVVVRSCNDLGKDWLAGRLAL